MPYVDRLGYEFAAILVTFVCFSSISSFWVANLHQSYQGHIPRLTRKKVRSFDLILNWQNNTQVVFFLANPYFLILRKFFKKTWICRKNLCYFASLSLYIFLKQPCMNVPYFELTWWYASIFSCQFCALLILKLC